MVRYYVRVWGSSVRHEDQMLDREELDVLRLARRWRSTIWGDDEPERARFAGPRRRSPPADDLPRLRLPLFFWGLRAFSSSCDEDEEVDECVRLRCRRSCSCSRPRRSRRPRSRSRSRQLSRRISRTRSRLRDGLREALRRWERSALDARLIASAGSSRSASLSAPRELLSSRERSRSDRPPSPSLSRSRSCLLVLVCGGLLGEDGEREEGRSVLTVTGRESGAEGCDERRADGGTTPRRFWSS